jgi:ABC-type xylose transport system substrate-binding protein
VSGDGCISSIHSIQHNTQTVSINGNVRHIAEASVRTEAGKCPRNITEAFDRTWRQYNDNDDMVIQLRTWYSYSVIT